MLVWSVVFSFFVFLFIFFSLFLSFFLLLWNALLLGIVCHCFYKQYLSNHKRFKKSVSIYVMYKKTLRFYSFLFLIIFNYMVEILDGRSVTLSTCEGNQVFLNDHQIWHCSRCKQLPDLPKASRKKISFLNGPATKRGGG